MKRLIILSALFLFTISGFAQKKDIPLKDYFSDAEFFFANEEYIDALTDYMELSKRGFSDNANINYKIGICYLYIPEQKEKSIDYLIKASANASAKYSGSSMNEAYAPLDVFLYLGNAYRVTDNLDKAIETYNKYLALLPDAAKEERNYTKKQIEACNIAHEFINDPLKVKFTNLGNLINTNNSNHNCVVSADGSTMVYMTKLPFYEGVFMSKRRGNNWSRPVNITPQIQSDGDQVITGISHDGKTILLAKADIFDSDIYISYFENGQWSKSKPIGKPVNSRYYESHASFAHNDSTIFFTSNRPGGIGEMDIYYSNMSDKGNWGEPKNVGPKVNTALNEDTPFLTEDGKTLYFSSQGHMNMGGYDFFKATFSDTGYSNPENLRYPLSTTDDDLFYYPWDNGKTGYVQKILDEGLGSWDIYSVAPVTEEEMQEPIAEQISEDVEEEANLQEVKQVGTQEKAVEFEVKPILFGFDAYNLTAGAKLEIDKYINLLKKNAGLNVTISGFTDALGPEDYNKMLSERRANTVKKYLTDNGIEDNRIEIQGLGETQFIALNENSDGSDNPEARKYNRRVEIEILGVDKDQLHIKKINIVPENLRFKN